MITASKSGLCVNIEKTPVPPQFRASAKTLRPSLKHHTSFDAAIKGRMNDLCFFSLHLHRNLWMIHAKYFFTAGTPTEVFAVMEKDLLYQVKLCEEYMLAFTQLVFYRYFLKYLLFSHS